MSRKVIQVKGYYYLDEIDIAPTIAGDEYYVIISNNISERRTVCVGFVSTAVLAKHIDW